MNPYNEDKMTKLDYDILKKKYDEIELKRVLKRIDDDYPVQYAIGNVDFLGHEIKVDERVLIPRFETELLVFKLMEYMQKYSLTNARVVDVCTGSGCIAISLSKKFSEAKVWAIDKSRDALDLARENAVLNDVDVTFLERDVLEDLSLDGPIDVLVSNPPYVKRDEVVSSNTKYEPSMALYPGEDDIIFYKRILEQSPRVLGKKGIIAFEIGSEQGERVSKVAGDVFPDARVVVEQDYAGLDRFVFVFYGM